MHLPQGVSLHDVFSCNFITFPAGVGRVLSLWGSLVAPAMAFSIWFTYIHMVGDTDGMCIAKWKMVAFFCEAIVCFSGLYLICMQLRVRAVVRSSVDLFICIWKLCRVLLFRWIH